MSTPHLPEQPTPPPSSENSRRRYGTRRTVSQRLDIVLSALVEARFTPLEFVATLVCAKDDRFVRYRTGLYKEGSTQIEEFLDATWADPKGKLHLEEWMRQGPALETICKQIEADMEPVKRQLLMALRDISIDYIKSWSINNAINTINVPESWSRILESACRGPQSDENRKKSSKLVSFSIRYL